MLTGNLSPNHFLAPGMSWELGDQISHLAHSPGGHMYPFCREGGVGRRDLQRPLESLIKHPLAS